MIAILSLFGCGNVEDEQTVTVENPTVIVIQEENKEAVADIDKTQQQNASETGYYSSQNTRFYGACRHLQKQNNTQ